MYYLVYISTAIKLLTDDELTDILTVSRKNNTKNNITGILLYSEGTFIQLLEGNQEKVEATYRIIENDIRHKNLIRLITGNIDERSISQWSMGFASTEKSVLKQIKGYIDPTDPGFLNTVNHTEAIQILRMFAEENKLTGFC